MIWTYHFVFAIDGRGPWFSPGHCDPTGGQISNPRVLNERYGRCLSIVTSSFVCRPSGLVTPHFQSRVLIEGTVWRNIAKLYPALKTDFWRLFYKMLSSEDNLIKMNETNCKWSQISQNFMARKSLPNQNIEPFFKLFMFEVWALFWQNQSVISPYHLACPLSRFIIEPSKIRK